MFVAPSRPLHQSPYLSTALRVKVSEVAWVSDDRADLIIKETSASVAPEICIEIFSNSNTIEEIEFKRNLYFQTGAGAVLFCNQEGSIALTDEP